MRRRAIEASLFTSTPTFSAESFEVNKDDASVTFPEGDVTTA
jgi:hypothetical protein